MKNKKIIYKNFIQKEYLNSKLIKKLNINFSKNIKKIINSLDIPDNIFHSFSKNFKFNFNLTELNKFKKFKTIAVIGMGGSSLGSEAIYWFLKKKIKKKFIFLNDVDINKIDKLKKEQNLSKVLFIVISKSGSTIETLSNFLALKIINNKSKNIIIISELNKNILHQLSQKKKIYQIAHKKYIGGRYSVLSEVGIVPAYFMGVSIKKLRENLLLHLRLNSNKFLKNSTVMLSSLLKDNKFKNIIFLNYIPQLEKFHCWNQQLIAESLGKKGKGFLPLISQAPKDYHSLLQLYLDGPKDKLFYIFSMNKNVDKKINIKSTELGLRFLNNKYLDEIKNAQKNAFIEILKKNKIPFREFQIKDYSEKTIGELFSYFMLETAIIGKLTNIDPFDQPAVEKVKIATKKLLI